MKILIVEDNKELNESLREILEMEEHIVDSVTDGRDAVILINKIQYDLIILDIMLPGLDGYSVAKVMREKGVKTPIIMLTALGQLDEKLRGFQVGADDYIVKPFEIPELIARINALYKRINSIQSDVIQLEDLTVDLNRRVVLKGGKEVEITPKLFCILEQLLRNRGKILTYEIIAGKCWEASENPSSDTIRANMKLLRRAIGDKEKDIIKTISGVGYRID